MSELPSAVINDWEKRKGLAVFTTVSVEGIPNTIYVSCISKFSPDTILIANNHFVKTLINIQSGCKGSILFITDNRRTYQIKGDVQYYEQGDYFDDMKKWYPPHRAGHGVAVLKVEEVYSGSKKLL
ncbi:MAG: pyridoxamine 5-phosphate oxidase [Desulfuromonas sp. SDB]|nr:MAG: pyridoxamine 5-phosphate oxidase [Desulfuromonas sp. SDB]